MAANISDKRTNDATTAALAVPKRITNAQTVCNQKNEKGKLCNGHLKQLRTAGEAAEVHLRGDDVLSKCQTCGTLYMGPPLGHVRDPQKQTRFVEAELTALLQAAGGTLPLIKKNEQGVYILVESETPQAAAKPAIAAKPTAAGTAAVPAAKPTTAKPAASAAAAKSAGHTGQNPNRQLFKRTTYAGVVDTGPVAGETFAEKVERLRKVSAGAKQRADEGGGEPQVTAAPAGPESITVATPVVADVSELSAAPATAPAPAAAHKPTGQADRTLMKRTSYCGVIDTGPVPGESFQQKVERLAKVSAAAKQRAEEGN